MRLKHVHLQQITIRALNAPRFPRFQTIFSVDLAHLIAKNNADNRMEVVFLCCSMDCTYVAMWFMWQTAKRKSKHEDEHGKKEFTYAQGMGNANRKISKGLAQQIGSYQGWGGFHIYFRLPIISSMYSVDSGAHEPYTVL